MSAADGFDTNPTYQEQVLRYRVVINRLDPVRNPEGAWSLVYSCSEASAARAQLVDMALDLPAGDAIKFIDGLHPTMVKRLVY
jgi:hypothetical protein